MATIYEKVGMSLGKYDFELTLNKVEMFDSLINPFDELTDQREFISSSVPAISTTNLSE